MSAKNIYHDAVVAALQADGWTITADPLALSAGGRHLYVDLAGERPTLAAERAGEKIAVEVQSFVNRSRLDDLYRAVGQYVAYRAVLRTSQPGRVLYLAVPDDAYAGILSEPIGRLASDDIGMRVVVFQPTERRILQWIS